jgi:hypothetical protein
MLTHGFRYKDNFHEEDKGLDCTETEGTIMDNNSIVGRNCLTFMRNTGNGDIRYKFYNKFVQSVESPSVRRAVGNHFANWCNNPETELREAIPKSLDTGLLRLEITFYRYDTSSGLSREYREEQMEYLASLVPPELLFHNPISSQWKLLLEKVHYNLMLVDLTNKLALTCLYLNRETGKTNGFYQQKDISENTLSNIAKLYTFDLPIVVLLVETVGNSLEVQQDTYTKVLDAGLADRKHKLSNFDTYCTSGDSFFKQCYAAEMDKQPVEMGLVSTPKCTLVQKT